MKYMHIVQPKQDKMLIKVKVIFYINMSLQAMCSNILFCKANTLKINARCRPSFTQLNLFFRNCFLNCLNTKNSFFFTIYFCMTRHAFIKQRQKGYLIAALNDENCNFLRNTRKKAKTNGLFVHNVKKNNLDYYDQLIMHVRF